MRKEDLASDIVYLVMIAIAVVLGLTVLQNLVGMFDEGAIPMGNKFVFSIVVVLIAIVFNALLIEAGHCLGAVIGGYKVVSFNVLWFNFYKNAKKGGFRFKEFDGLTGETKIIPKKEKTRPGFYVWFPVLLYFVELIAVIVIFAISKNNMMADYVWLVVSSFIFACVGGLIILYDYVPLRLDSMTDGYRLTLLSKPVNRIAFNKMLVLNYQIESEIEVDDVPLFQEITDFTANINMRKATQYMLDGDYDSPISIFELVIKDPKLVSASTQYNAIAGIVSCYLLKGDTKKASKFYDDVDGNAKKFISNDVSAICVRAYMMVSGILEKSRSEVNYALSKKNKALKYVPKSDKEKETKLFDLALQQIKEKSPELFENSKEEQ